MSDALMDLIAVNDDQHLVYSEEERTQAFSRLRTILQKPKEYAYIGTAIHRVLTLIYEELEETEEAELGDRHLWFSALDKFEEYLERGFPTEYQKIIEYGVHDFMREYLGLKIVD